MEVVQGHGRQQFSLPESVDANFLSTINNGMKRLLISPANCEVIKTLTQAFRQAMRPQQKRREKKNAHWPRLLSGVSTSSHTALLLLPPRLNDNKESKEKKKKYIPDWKIYPRLSPPQFIPHRRRRKEEKEYLEGKQRGGGRQEDGHGRKKAKSWLEKVVGKGRNNEQDREGSGGWRKLLTVDGVVRRPAARKRRPRGTYMATTSARWQRSPEKEICVTDCGEEVTTEDRWGPQFIFIFIFFNHLHTHLKKIKKIKPSKFSHHFLSLNLIHLL